MAKESEQMNIQKPDQAIQIVDVIKHKNKHSTQTFVVTDREPVFLYQKEQNLLIAEDSGFFRFYRYEKPVGRFEAFAGRKFEIPMADGELLEASGQWWDHFPQDYRELLDSVGTSSPDSLAECNVFCGRYVDLELISDWLKKNEPSNNYNKYRKNHPDYMKHTIESPW